MLSFMLLAASLAADPMLTPGGLPRWRGEPLSQTLAWSALRSTARVSSGNNNPPFGTAVCIEVQQNQAKLLTAAHVLVRGEPRVFDFYQESSYPLPAQTVIGYTLIDRWADADLALIEIRLNPNFPAPSVVPLAVWAERPRRFPTPVWALGCPGGSAPRWREDRLLARRYFEFESGLAAFYWETTTSPVGGMSGGPLLNPQGELLGICTARRGELGYFTHLDEICAAIKRAGHGNLVPVQARP